MKFYLQTHLACKPESAWHEVKKPSLLMEVAKPVVKFKPVSPAVLPSTWPNGKSIQLKSYLFGFIPLGLRTVYFERIDDERMEIQTREHDALIHKWDHLISIKRTEGGQTLYSDSLELDAGLFTLPVWLFAHYFYRHRQRRWRKLSKRLRMI